MFIKQISVFLENKSGRLAEVTRLLSEGGVNLLALSIADTADFGVLRIIADHPEKAHDILKSAGIGARVTEVIAVCVSDKPGGLYRALSVLENENISVEYIYAFTAGLEGDALVIFRVRDNARAVETLGGAGIRCLDREELKSL